jgi:hypothetical protein
MTHEQVNTLSLDDRKYHSDTSCGERGVAQNAKTTVRRWFERFRNLSAFYVLAFKTTVEALNSHTTRCRMLLRYHASTPPGDVLLPDKPGVAHKSAS